MASTMSLLVLLLLAGAPCGVVCAARGSIDEVLSAHGLATCGEPNATIGMQMEESSTLLQMLLRPMTRTYVEWGSGGSTELVSWLIVSGQMPKDFHAYSVESSTDWIQYMRSRSSLIRKAEELGQMTYLHGSLGKTGHLGYPKEFNPNDHTRVLSYVGLSDKLGRRKVDLALVDGRFRLACMLESLKHLRHGKKANSGSDSHSSPHSVVLLHDYILKPPGLHQARFDEYSRALEFYDLLQRNRSLATFAPKASVSMDAASAALDYALGRPDR